MKTKKKTGDIVTLIVLILLSVVVILPVLFMVTHSFMSDHELNASYGKILTSSKNDEDDAPIEIDAHLIPQEPSLKGYWDVFLATPDYLGKFWLSLGLCAAITAGQTLLACLGGYGFAKFKYPGKNLLFALMVLLMMLPLQVTLVPNYIVLDKLGMIGSYSAIILPGICSAFGVFLLTQTFRSIPDSVLEAARLDGANQFKTLLLVVIPQAKAGIASLVILNFIDTWNMVEQPLVFLKDRLKYPLSIFLSQIKNADLSRAFVCGILAMLPVLLLFLHFKDALMTGIENSALK
ncbi:MAG: carbohydrate ABC transporter permease [Clostridia bacterium]|nr:carbohydrate ABC transporter permease [Clostridia bacterium]